MVGVEREAWLWVLGSTSSGFRLNYSIEAHRNGSIKYLLKKGLLTYAEDGGLVLSDKGINLYHHYCSLQDTLITGLPITGKELIVDSEYIEELDWVKTTVFSKRVLFDGSCMVVGIFDKLLDRPITDIFNLELKISSILDDIGNGFGVPVTPFAYQRLSLMDPGLVWFRSELGLFSIQEAYYDFLFSHLGKWMLNVGLALLIQDKRYLVVHYSHTKLKLDHDVVGIVAECVADDWPALDLGLEDEVFQGIEGDYL